MNSSRFCTGAVAVAVFFSACAVQAQAAAQALPPLTWQPPALQRPVVLQIGSAGTYDLRSDTDYVIRAPLVIRGRVHLRGGRNIVWIGGRIDIPEMPQYTPATTRNALVISDHNATRGNPARFGYSKIGRIVHIEGLRILGKGLAEGIDTNCPSAIVQLQNIRVEWVGFVNSDDRDGVLGWPAENHPDVLQTWGSQRELRVDGLSGTSTYQGIFLKEDVADAVKGPVRLRRVDIRARRKTGNDGVDYAGHRMFAFYAGKTGKIYLDPGTVRVESHRDSGWVRAQPSPSGAFWHSRYYNAAQKRHVLERPPGTSVFTDAVGDRAPTATGEDAAGKWLAWTGTQVLDWNGTQPGRIYSASGKPTYVPAQSVGLNYRSPGYRTQP